MNRERLIQSTEFDLLKQKYNSNLRSFLLANLGFSEWSRIQNQVGFAILQMTGGKVTMEDVLDELKEYSQGARVEPEPYSETNWKWKDVEVGDKFTTEGLRSFSSGGDAYDAWEEVIKVEGEKIFLEGFKDENDWWSAIWGDHNQQYYTLCRHQSKNK